MEWSDDRPSRRVVKLKCVQPCAPIRMVPGYNDLDIVEQEGCGWTGNSIAISTLCTTEYQIEDCPHCGGPVCRMDDR